MFSSKFIISLKICELLAEKNRTAREIAEITGYSPKYIEHCIFCLRAAGLVLSRRGKGGGYGLANSEINALNVFEASCGIIVLTGDTLLDNIKISYKLLLESYKIGG